MCKNQRYVEPTIEEYFGEDEPSKTVVTLPLVAKDHALFEKGHEIKSKEIERRAEDILVLLKETPMLSIPALSEKLQLSLKQTRTAIKYLKDMGRIH